jgi:hypothetical protein
MIRALSFVAVLMAMTAACGGGDDEGEEKSPNKGDDGAAGKEGTLACAAETCELPDGLEDEELCCKDPFAGGCGIKAGATCRDFPDVDDRCKPLPIMVNIPGVNGMKIFGCCTGSGQCGVDFGMGCQPRSIACGVVGPDQVSQIQPMTCDGEALELPANCGMSMFRPPFAGEGG